MGHLDTVIREGSSGTTGRLNDRSVTIAEVLRDAGYFTAMSGKWHLGQQNGSPPWQRGFERVLSLRAGGMYFPNQNFQGGGDELTRRAQEPLYLDGTPTPRDAPVFGQNWYATSLWTDFGLKFIDEARTANKPFFLYLAHNAPHFPLMAPAGVDCQTSRQVQSRLGPPARRPLSPADHDGADRRQVAAQPAGSGLAGVGLAVGRRQGPLRSSDGGLCRDGRGDRYQRRRAGQRSGDARRARQHAHPVHDGQRRQRRVRSGRALQRQPARRTELEPLPGDELGCARQHSVPAVQALHPRRGHRRAAHRALAPGHSRQPPQRPRASARPSHRRDADARRRRRRDVSSRVQGPDDPADGRRQPAFGVCRSLAPSHAASLLGTRGQPRRPLGQLEAGVDLSG